MTGVQNIVGKAGAGQRNALASMRLSPVAIDSIVIVALVLLLTLVWSLSAREVTVRVDGMDESLRTRRATVGDVLADAGVALDPLDRVSPAVDTSTADGMTIEVERARRVRVLADGRDLIAATWGATVADALRDAGISFDAYDRALVDGVDATLDTVLPELDQTLAPGTWARGHAWQRVSTEPVQIRVRRAVPLTVSEGGVPYTIRTTAPTVGEALRQAEVTLYLGDKVEPSLGSSVTPGLSVAIARSTPVSIQVDGMRTKTRTQASTVGDALANLGIIAAGLDRIEPPIETPLYANIEIKVTRVNEEIEVEEEIEPFETRYVGDPNFAIDTQQMIEPGAEGIQRKRYRVRYEDGEAVERTLEDEWIAQEPATRVIAYGQRIEPQTATVDGQSITYWRRIKMLATSYSPGTAGGSVTRTGDAVRPGIVAIDPRLVPLRSRVFVPNYGFGDALDTGGGIISRRIDLAYDDASYVPILRWTDVYLLWPPPSAGDITWVVPNYPNPPNE
jgi:uncharacterized protein YabE (DUF348 family)